MNMDYNKLADLIFPNAKEIEYYEEKYPERNLPEGAMVTRFAPSPTGFVHIGGLFGAIIDRKLAQQSNGVFILRIEDTDQKREIENGTAQIVNSLKDFGINPDEGMVGENEEKGNYGPYKQSERKDIYQAYAKSLIKRGLAYPCFCTPEELEEIRAKQENAKIRTGYYGVWAKYRTLPVEQAVEKIKNGEKYIIRFKSQGREDRKIKHKNKKENKTMEKTMKIEGMMCPHCEATVKKTLEAIDGVELAEVSHEKGTAVLTMSKNVEDSVLKKAVEDAGYKVNWKFKM